jgi:tetratricopeptide (TPR) repeat protein
MAKGRPRRIFHQSTRTRTQQVVSPATRLQEAIALHKTGQLSQAETIYREILAHIPTHFDALQLMGHLRGQKGQYESAVEFFRQAIKINSKQPLLHYNLGLALQHLNRPEEALGCYNIALALKPDYVEALNNQGMSLHAMHRAEEALVSYDRALALRPDYIEALNNRGTALHVLHRLEQALACYDRTLVLKPDHIAALNNRGMILYDLTRLDEALACYDRAVVLKPDFAAAHWNRSLCQLLTGDFEHGSREFEWRWESAQQALKRDFTQPLWTGEQSVEGKTILLHAEQGLGDTIQFCRYAQLVAARGATVLLEVQPSLKALLSELKGVTKVFARGELLPAFHYHCPLLSLPLAFSTTLDTIPAEIPYLSSNADRVNEWRFRLGSKTLPRIGLTWSGSSGHRNDANRSIPLAEFAHVLTGDAHLVSLQREVRPADQAILDAHKDIVHFGHELKDFADTAALANLMDVVITVDTAVAHLAGAMGKPVWILLPFAPDWRWLLDREDSPWYPSARLFRPSAVYDRASMIASAQAELGKLIERISGEAKH